ncbi:MAG: hypothetical protein MUE85_04505 [Microscillaceae bacterium]|jgi:hypothetical protein|nr:hypothetical protein [Microscillaceae bacterium]
MSNLDKPTQARFIRRQVFAQTAGTRFTFFFLLITGAIPGLMSWYFAFNATRYPEMAKSLGKTQNLYFLIAASLLLGALFVGLYLVYQRYKTYKTFQFIFDNGKEFFFKVEKVHLEGKHFEVKLRRFEIETRSELGELIELKTSDIDLIHFLGAQQGEFLAYQAEKYPQRIIPVNLIKHLAEKRK